MFSGQRDHKLTEVFGSKTQLKNSRERGCRTQDVNWLRSKTEEKEDNEEYEDKDELGHRTGDEDELWPRTEDEDERGPRTEDEDELGPRTEDEDELGPGSEDEELRVGAADIMGYRTVRCKVTFIVIVRVLALPVVASHHLTKLWMLSVSSTLAQTIPDHAKHLPFPILTRKLSSNKT